MSVIAGLQDFRGQAAPADTGVFQVPCGVMVFPYIFSGTTYYCAVRSGERGWILVDYGTVPSTVLNAALALGQSPVYVDAGTYVLTAMLNVPSNMKFEGGGIDITIFDVTALGTGISVSNQNSVELCNFTVTDDYEANCVSISDGSSDVWVHHVRTYRGDVGIVVQGVTEQYRIHISDCLCEESGDDDITFTGLVIDSTIINNFCKGYTRSPALNGAATIEIDDGAYQCSVIGNIITDKVTGIAIHHHDGLPAPHHIIVADNEISDINITDTFGGDGIRVYIAGAGTIQDIIIHSNDLKDIENNGISLDYAERIIVKDNQLYDFAKVGVDTNGINVTSNSSRILIVANFLHDAGANNYAGISIGGDDCAVADNYLLNCDVKWGINVEADDALIVANYIEACGSDTRGGINLNDASGCHVGLNYCIANTYDGIIIQGSSDNNSILNNALIDNTHRGIDIFGGTGNRVLGNVFRGNVLGAISDEGTDTVLETKTFQFQHGGSVEGTVNDAEFISATASAKGWRVDGGTDWAATLGQLPLELQQIVRIKIWAVALGAPIDTGGQMHLEIIMNAGADNLAFNTEPIALVNFDSVTTDYIANDVLHWAPDAGDDADIGHMAGGMSIEVKIIYEAGADPDGATNAIFRSVEIEYV